MVCRRGLLTVHWVKLRASVSLAVKQFGAGWLVLQTGSVTDLAVLAVATVGHLQDRPTGQDIRRYERSRPGELVHVDVKKLGRIPDNWSR